MVLGGNQGVGIMTYSYFYQMGHLFNHCPFVDDRLRQLLKESHDEYSSTTTITVPNVFILGTQDMNPNICQTTIPINYHTTWSQLVTPIVPSKTDMLPTSTYPMWYNVIPPFVPLNPSLCPAYPIKTKGLHSLIFRNYTCYVLGNVYPVPE
jgi:hypothetical protein